MKKIINDPERVVSEMLAGIEISDSSLKYIPGFEVIARREPNKEKVAIISGGGSGHEPAHAGYVGRGMLDAAVAGNVFASPSPDRILEAIHQVGGDKGILMVIKNYSGDIMNFSMAAELAEMEGYKVIKAYDGLEALEKLTENSIQLILIDVMMPKLDGLSTMMKIREI